ncbi:MAG: tetratricopeptide repeat protein [Saprospiraceae bacterium]|nr:tetratricopeptide repeat protein [Saprospiraceae bacterium]MBK9631921.1 tetratricopeptide repeat protein [Saprospiraceae bacterium]
MRLLIVFLFLTISISESCKNAAPSLSKDLEKAEKAFNDNPTDSTYNDYITKVLEHFQNSPKGTDQSGILIKAAKASEQMKKLDQEIIFLNNIIKNYPNLEDNHNRIYRMIGLLHGTNRHSTADVMAVCYMSAYPEDPRNEELKTRVPKAGTPQEYMMEIARSIFADTLTGFNEAKARTYVDACEAYAMTLPKDPETPQFLFKAAETSNTLRTYEKSFSLYDWIIEQYPTHDRAPVSLFMKGFLFDGTLKDSANAAKFYTEFIEKYPSNPFAKDAKMLMQNLGKTDEEVLQELMKKGEANQ